MDGTTGIMLNEINQSLKDKCFLRNRIWYKRGTIYETKPTEEVELKERVLEVSMIEFIICMNENI
jgi:hypothetical protein